MIECNKITEIYKGHYQMILDFPDINDLYKIININYKYIWIYDYIESPHKWSSFKGGIYGISLKEDDILARNIKMELLYKTEDFLKIIPSISRSVKLIQTNIEPPYYLDLSKLNGVKKYNLLKEKADYLFDIDMPKASDYTPIISQSKEYLENLIKKFTYNN